ncbi:EpsG family protein [Bifidobacterium aquikefiri]|uniref:EpsG family protein n=1 Tax=Bifidobacterium aquikefiri TaxID=1653207 RepID=UPI0023F38547|nr:hypothetical protein [Bifidobacterium aquikefiri]
MVSIIYLLVSLALLFSFGYTMHIQGRRQGLVIQLSLVLFVLIITYVASQIQFSGYADVIRMHDEMLYAQTYGFTYLLKEYLINPGSAVLLYLVSPSGSSAILQAFAAFVFFTALSYIFFITYKTLNFPVLPFLVTCWLAISSFGFSGMVGGVRNFPAMGLSSAAILSMTLIKKNKTIFPALLCCVAAGLFHVGAWVQVILFILSRVKKAKIRVCINITLSLYGFFAVFGAAFAMKFLPGKNFWSGIYSKVNGYFISGSSFDVYSSVNRMLLMYFEFILIIAALLIYVRNSKKNNSVYKVSNTYASRIALPKAYTSYLITYVCFCIGSIPSGTPFRRYTSLLVFNAIPLVTIVISQIFYEPAINHSYASEPFSPIYTNLYRWKVKKFSIQHISALLIILLVLIVFTYNVWHQNMGTYIV